MQRLERNVLIQLALELDTPSLVKFCSSSKKINEIICANNIFWMKRLNKEYPRLTGKFPRNTNYKRIYESLVNKEKYSYYVFKGECYNTLKRTYLKPKFWNYIKKVPITGDDYDLAEKIYPDFVGLCGEDFSFNIIGDFPKGTKIWLPYSSYSDLDLRQGYPSKEEAIDTILYVVDMLLRDSFSNAKEEIEKYYGSKTKDQLLEDFRKQVNEKGYFEMYDVERDEYDWYIIKEFEIVDYREMLKELKEKHSDWKKLPKDMIEYILRFLN